MNSVPRQRPRLGWKEGYPEGQAIRGKLEWNLVPPVAPDRDRRPKQRAMKRLMIFVDDFEREPFLKLLHRQDGGILRVISLSCGDGAMGRSREESNGSHLRPDQAFDMAAEVLLPNRAMFHPDAELPARRHEILAVEFRAVVHAKTTGEARHRPGQVDFKLAQPSGLVENASGGTVLRTFVAADQRTARRQ